MKRDTALNKRLVSMLAVILAFAFITPCVTGCADREIVTLPVLADYEKPETEEDARTHLKVGVILGPYSDMFAEAISPSLYNKGYTVELVQYNDYTLPNEYLADGQTDLNMFQHYLDLINYKSEHDVGLSAVAKIPTATMGIYSEKHKSLNDIDDGFKVSLPEDGFSFAHALTVLESAGIIKLRPGIDKTVAREDDIISNPHRIELFPLEEHTLPHLLSDYDLAVIGGIYAVSGGLDLSGALYTEQPDAYHFNVIAVRTEDLHEQFVEDIIDVLRSDDYRAVIENPDGIFADFQKPPNFRD